MTNLQQLLNPSNMQLPHCSQKPESNTGIDPSLISVPQSNQVEQTRSRRIHHLWSPFYRLKAVSHHCKLCNKEVLKPGRRKTPWLEAGIREGSPPSGLNVLQAPWGLQKSSPLLFLSGIRDCPLKNTLKTSSVYLLWLEEGHMNSLPWNMSDTTLTGHHLTHSCQLKDLKCLLILLCN